MKKKVLLVIRWPVGGIRTFLRYVYHNFDKSKYHFTIIAPDLEEMEILIDGLSSLDLLYIPVPDMPVDGSSGILKMFRYVSFQLMKEKYDLLHSHGFTSGMCSAIPAFLRRTPHLMTSHETINENQFIGPKGKAKLFGMALLFNLINKVHSVSYDAQNNLHEYFPLLGRKNKSIVIPNGIQIKPFIEAERRDLRVELGLGDDIFIIGFFGRFMGPKGFRYLVDAIDTLRKDDLPKQPLVLSFGDGGFIREEKQAIQNRGLEEFFRFMPFTLNVAGTLKGVDVVAMPSLWEACPLVAMEAMVCGTPIIGTDCIGLREVLRDTPAMVVSKANSDALAQALRSEILASSRDKHINFVEVAVKRFDVTDQSQKLLSTYEILLL